MTDLIPPKIKQWAGLVVSILVVVLGAMSAWADMGNGFVLWSGRAAMMLVIISNVLGLSVPGVKAKVVAPVLTLLFAVGLMASACNPNAVAWRTIDGVQQARVLTAQQIATAGRVKHKTCLATHGAGTDDYRVCIEPTRKMLRHWQRDARPAIIAGVQITASSLQIAEKVGGKDVGWLDLIKPAICALTRVVKLYGHYLPDKGKSISGVLNLVEGGSCGR